MAHCKSKKKTLCPPSRRRRPPGREWRVVERLSRWLTLSSREFSLALCQRPLAPLLTLLAAIHVSVYNLVYVSSELEMRPPVRLWYLHPGSRTLAQELLK